jgi:hypothetical protein
VWLWASATGATPADVDRWWQAFLRRFDLEQTFRLLKRTLGWTRPKLRTPEAADRRTWLIIAAHAHHAVGTTGFEPATPCPQPWCWFAPIFMLT